MKTHPEICKEFDVAVERLEAHRIKLSIADLFGLVQDGILIFQTDRVEDLTSFVAGLNYARGAA